jgi:hypothetical protein
MSAIRYITHSCEVPSDSLYILQIQAQSLETSHPPLTSPPKPHLLGFSQLFQILSLFPILPPFLLSLSIQTLGLVSSFQQCAQIEPTVVGELRGAVFDLYLSNCRQNATPIKNLDPYQINSKITSPGFQYQQLSPSLATTPLITSTASSTTTLTNSTNSTNSNRDSNKIHAKQGVYSLYTNLLHPYWVLDLLDLMVHKLTQGLIAKAAYLATKKDLLYSLQSSQSPSNISLLASPLLTTHNSGFLISNANENVQIAHSVKTGNNHNNQQLQLQNHSNNHNLVTNNKNQQNQQNQPQSLLPIHLDSILDQLYPLQYLEPSFSNMNYVSTQYGLIHHAHSDFNVPDLHFVDSYDLESSMASCGLL